MGDVRVSDVRVVTPRRVVEAVAALGAVAACAGVWLLVGLAWALIAIGVATAAWALVIVDVPADVGPPIRPHERK